MNKFNAIIKTNKRSLFILSILIYITALLLYGFWINHYNEKEILEHIDTNLYNHAISLKYLLPNDYHDRAINAQSISIDEDKYIANKLTRIVKEAGFKYNYTIIKKDEKIFFVASDLIADPERDRGTFYYYEYEGADEIFFHAFEKETPTYKTVSDQWGTFRTIIVPEKSLGGTQYLACVDYDITYVKGLLQKNLLKSIATVFFFLLLTIPIIKSYSTSHKNFIENLKESEEKYRRLTENAKDMIYRMSLPDGYFEYVSPASIDLTGYTPEEFYSTPIIIKKIILPDWKDYFKEQWEDLLSGNVPPSYEYQITHKSGEERWVYQRNVLVKDENANPVAIEGIATDITDRKSAEQRLEKSEQELQTVLSCSPVGLGLVIDRKLNWGNTTIYRMFGYEQGALTGVSAQVLYPNKEEFERVGKLLYPGIPGSDIGQAEARCIKKDGTIFDCFLQIASVDKSDLAKGQIVSMVDVTVQKKAEKEREKLQDQLAQAQKMESMGLLAGGVAHDLNNILSGIVTYPELLLMDLPEGSKLIAPLKTIMDSGIRAAAIVQDLLTTARSVAITKSPLKLNDLVAECINSPEVKKLEQISPDVVFKTHYDQDLFNIYASDVHIRKALMNLILNAADAVKTRGNISISTLNRYLETPLKGYEKVSIGEYAVLSIADNGPGISSKDLGRIFEPFYTKKKMGRSGTGLGLSVVWNVIRDHQGFIDVKTGDSGTTFELYFPITRDVILSKDLSLSIKSYKGNGEMVLVVDDENNQREISCKILDKLGYEYEAVSSGEEAIEYLQQNSVDLVLLDMIMNPGISGYETYKMIINIHPGQKAVILSGFSETDDVKRTLSLGAGRYVKKPVTIEKMGLAIKEVLKK